MLESDGRVSVPGRVWPSERDVADEVAIDVDSLVARRVLGEVPLWFHTFALNAAKGLYTPGKARDHGYRLASIPDSFEGMSVLDIGTFDGFYAFMAEARGATRVLAVDNEQYIEWVRDRWGVELEGAEGFNAIHGLLGSNVEYRRMDAFEAATLDEKFDFVFCFGILHRVEDPIGLLRVLRDCLTEDGVILLETYGIREDEGAERGAVLIPEPAEIYPRDGHVYWQFSSGALDRLAALAGLGRFVLHDAPIVDEHPRIIGQIERTSIAT
jgi:tRNA (mo5U34)-methyltransferase